MDLSTILQQVKTVVSDVVEMASLSSGKVLVIGCSTSEVVGKLIGKAGSEEVASVLFQGIKEVADTHGLDLAFQCCEHLNRALVVERSTMNQLRLDEVTVIPVPSAGGSMAAHAFRHLSDSVVVESIQADAGIDIGDTFIGMHLKRVAVPVRPSLRLIGEAHVTAAYTRPKLIGGARAVYEITQANTSCS
ncbi:TIGR01440 family protein [Brevibacillus sp. SYSU BS000544]|uniref:TIGR01440 family protein n=1 Tax=Brevibacillus sp. SYSU BS000544 TaxID=3416443 RepID=UPI003CE5B702